MDPFRILLFILGSVIVVFIIGYMAYSGKTKRKVKGYRDEFHELVENTPDDDGTVSKVKIEKSSKPADKPQVEKTWADYYQINVVCRDHRAFTIDDLRRVFAAQGLVQGPHNIYYCTEGGQELFRVANLIKPGIFPPANDKADNWVTRGICVIMFMPKSTDALVRFEKALKVASEINESLDGLICAKDLTPINDTVLAEYRKQLQAFDAQK